VDKRPLIEEVLYVYLSQNRYTDMKRTVFALVAFLAFVTTNAQQQPIQPDSAQRAAVNVQFNNDLYKELETLHQLYILMDAPASRLIRLERMMGVIRPPQQSGPQQTRTIPPKGKNK
jgi:hypothetical protein